MYLNIKSKKTNKDEKTGIIIIVKIITTVIKHKVDNIFAIKYEVYFIYPAIIFLSSKIVSSNLCSVLSSSRI